MDPRLRVAVDAGLGWYADLFALHGVPWHVDQGLWVAGGAPPPLHSHAVVAERGVQVDGVLRALEPWEVCGFKDSFASLDASSTGMRVLFEATWVHRAPPGNGMAPMPEGWIRVRTPTELARWTDGHDTADILLPGLLDRGQFAVLARTLHRRIVAGAVARLCTGVAYVSNVHADPGHEVDWDELAHAVWSLYPGRALVGYEHGPELARARSAGFDAVGDLRVWAR